MVVSYLGRSVRRARSAIAHRPRSIRRRRLNGTGHIRVVRSPSHRAASLESRGPLQDEGVSRLDGGGHDHSPTIGFV